MKPRLYIHILKWIDRLFGPFGIYLSQTFLKTRSDSFVDPARCLFIRPGGIGDAVLLIPIIKELKKRLPHVVIDILAEKRNGMVFSLCTDLNRILHYDKQAELLTVMRSRYDAVIDTEQWHRLSAVVARLTRAPMLIGYATNERKRLFTHPIPYSHDDYEVNSFVNLLTPLTGSLSVKINKPFLTVPEESSSKIRSLLKPIVNKRIVALFPGGSIQERRWGNDRFHQTAQALIDRGFGVVVIGGRDDRQAGNEITAGLHSIINFCGQLSLIETAAVLKEAALIITGDSGILHLGFGLGIKTVALFGPGIERKWAPRGENHIVINKHLHCSPCTKFGYTPRCAYNVACMRQITVDEVYVRALELLER